jgi:hypothetical protein
VGSIADEPMRRLPLFFCVLLCGGCPGSPRQEGRDLAVPPDLIVTYDFSHPDLASPPRDQAMAQDIGIPDLFAGDKSAPMDLAAPADGPPVQDLALPKADLEINYCIIQFPAMTSTKANVPTVPIYGRVYQAGLTDANNGPAPGIVAQLGYGPQGTDPRIAPSWVWVDAMPNQGWNFAQANDEYQATLTVANVGGYSYAYRFSVTQRAGFTYCDTVGNGSNNGLPAFDPQKDGSLTVN